jgi:transcriptional regulator with XRE-family HTH domain
MLMFLPFRLRDLYILVFLFNKALNVKQNWLSEQLGKSYNLVNSYVQNRRQLSIEDLYKIAEILSVDVTELLKSKTNV